MRQKGFDLSPDFGIASAGGVEEANSLFGVELYGFEKDTLNAFPVFAHDRLRRNFSSRSDWLLSGTFHISIQLRLEPRLGYSQLAWAHYLGCDTEKMRPISEIRLRFTREPDIHLIQQSIRR